MSRSDNKHTALLSLTGAVAPVFKNELLHSNNMTDAVWQQTDPGMAAFDAVGIDGDPNTASTLTDDSVVALENAQTSFTIPDDSNPVTFVTYIRASLDANLPEIQLVLGGGTTQALNSQFDRQSGNTFNRTVIGPVDTAVKFFKDNTHGDYWAFYQQLNNNSTGNVIGVIGIAPAFNTTGLRQDGALTATGSIEILNVEGHLNKTISQAMESPVIINAGVSADVDGVLSGDIDSMEDAWLKSVVAAPLGNTTNDLWLAYFLENGATSGEFNSAAFEYLGGQGHTGALTDRWDSFWAAGGPGGVSAEVQAVFDRMSALTPTEMGAIETLVDGLVFDGDLYSAMPEIYAPCLNGTDFLTGFKTDTLINSAAPGVHTPGEYIDFTANNQHLLEGRAFDSFAISDHFIGAYIVLYDADTVNNSDLFGVATGVNECYYRWRGNDTNDENAIIFVTAATPRAVGMVRPTGDIVGAGFDGVTSIHQLIVGGVTDVTARTFEGIPTTHPLQWHGQNIDGTPSAGNMGNSRYSVMFHLDKTSPPNITTIRTRMLQFLIDIGVSGVPTP